jgi:mannose-6-phosphate isomerase-like protein (cupin superfamily)
LKENKNISKETIRQWLNDDESPDPSAEEILQSEEALFKMAESYSKPAPEHLRSSILQKINTLNAQKNHRQKLDVAHLPMLDEDSNWLDWAEAIKEIHPPENYHNIHLHSLESNEKRDLFVAWVKEYVPEEVHYDLLESFMILEGTCECHITDQAGDKRVVRMVAGDFITMQLGESHDIFATSPEPTKAILQWVKLAA